MALINCNNANLCRELQWIYALAVAFGGIGLGMSLSWTATALPSVQNTLQFGHDLSSSEISLIGSFLTVGALISCPVTAYGMSTYGRKPCLLYLCLVSLPGWIIMAFGTTTLHLYVGRVLTGIYAGGCTIVIPVYIKEIASPENRGVLGSLFMIMLCVGKLISNIVGVLVEANQASLLSALQPLIHATILISIPESPTFHSKLKTQSEETTVQQHSSGIYSLARNYKPVAIVFVLILLAQICGINVFTFFTNEMFQQNATQMKLLTPQLGMISLSVIQVIGGLPASLFVDRYGRKCLLISSLVVMAISTGVLGLYYYFETINAFVHTSYSDYIRIIPLIFLAFYCLAYSWGMGSIVWIIMSEIIPTQIIALVSFLANALYWFMAFLITFLYQLFINQVPLYIWLVMFCFFCVMGVFFVVYCVPETKGARINVAEEQDRKSNGDWYATATTPL